MLTLIAQIDRKIKNAFVFVAAMSFTQGSHGFVNLPQAQSILSEPPVPIWVIDDDPAFAKGYAVWMQSRSSAEGRAFALSIVYQQLRLESLDSHADIPERDLESRYQSMWNMLTLEDRLLAFILQPETKELWRGSPSDGVSVEQFQRNREFVTATVLQLLTELDKQLALSEYLPTRLVDVAPSLPVYPGTHPEDINDPVVRAEYIEASRVMQENQLHNAVQRSLIEMAQVVEASLPVLLENAFDFNSESDQLAFINLTNEYRLPNQDWFQELVDKHQVPEP